MTPHLVLSPGPHFALFATSTLRHDTLRFPPMKPSALLLAGSLAANAALVAFFVLRPTTSPSAAVAAASPGPQRGAAAGTADAKATDPAPASSEKLWAQLQSGNLATLADRLRAAGFPPAMVRALVAAQVNEQFSARRKGLLAGQEERAFWKSQQNFFLDRKNQAALRALGKEQNDLLKSLLGADGIPGGDETLAWQRRQFGNLPADKLTALQNINNDYSELQQEIYTKANGLMLPEDRTQLAFLEKEKLADMQKALSPQEFEDYQLRSSNTANQLRSQLATFNATEAEFRALYKVAAVVDEQSGSAGPFGPRNPGDFQARQAALLAQTQAVLSPERFAEYKQATDPQSQQINRLVARLELPAATTQQVVAVQQDIQTRARALQSNRDLPAADRAAQLAALSAEATAKLTTALTPRGLEAYKQNGGFWLENLKPRTASAPSASPNPALPPNAVPAFRLPGG